MTASPSLSVGGITPSATSTASGCLPSSTTLSAWTLALEMEPWLSTFTAARALRALTEASAPTVTVPSALSTVSSVTWEAPSRDTAAPLVFTHSSPVTVESFTVSLASPALGATITPPSTSAASTVTLSAATSTMPSTSPVTEAPSWSAYSATALSSRVTTEPRVMLAPRASLLPPMPWTMPASAMASM